MPSRTTRRSTPPLSAPSAIRSPSSFVRCDTEYASTPYVPMAATRSATAANTPSSAALSRGWAALVETHSVIGRTFDSGRSGSIAFTFSRTAATMGAGSVAARITMSISGQVRTPFEK